MRHFKDIESVRAASVEELEQAPQMNKRAALAVYGFFHEDRQEGSKDGVPSNTQAGAPSGTQADTPSGQ